MQSQPNGFDLGLYFIFCVILVGFAYFWVAGVIEFRPKPGLCHSKIKLVVMMINSSLELGIRIKRLGIWD